MTLYLTMVRCPDNSPPETRAVEAGEFSIGRGATNNWVLHDSKRYLSSRHCVIAFHSNRWEIRDYSLNGTFINSEDKPIGEGTVRDLHDGDRLQLGPYEIEIRLPELPIARRAAPASGNMGNPFDLDPFAPRSPAQQPVPDPLLDDLGTGDPASAGVTVSPSTLPHDYNPLDPDPPSHGAEVGAPGVPAVAFSGSMASALLPEDWDSDDVPHSEPAATPAAGPPAAGSDGAGDLLQIFLRGAGLDDARPSDPAAAMEALGATFREVVFGLRRVMMARRDVKTEFRIETTGILPSGNNPLKFSTSDDDALAALLGAGRRSDMTAVEAVAQALNDVRVHELASLAAMQSAVRALLAEFEPSKLSRAAGEGGLNFVSGQRKARAWDAFEAQYKQLSEALADNFNSAYSKAFAVAYEKALAEVAARGNPR
jgi:type VI secretion system FHA domain protein